MNPAASNCSQGNILIVDDSPDNLRVLSTTLMERGYKVRCVKSGAMALIGVQANLPDLILLDIRMPEVNGYEVCQRIKANPETAEIPIIFLSALDEILDKVKAFQVGGADYITKPFHIQEVLARVESQLTIRRLQQQLLQKNQHLQQEIYEHQQTEAALRVAKEASEAASYAKSAFLAQMSHELRTPLNHILGFTNLLQKEDTLAPIHQEYLNKIYGSGRHLLKLINNILTLTQVDNGQLSLNQQDFDLLGFLNELQSSWQLKLGNQMISLTTEYAPDMPFWIHADQDKLNHILNSILDHVCQFTSQSSITLRVAPLNPPAESNSDAIGTLMLQFEVEDTGLGIGTGELRHLFRGFTQSDSDRSSEAGNGLGLSVSRQLIQRMGGDITICSPSSGETLVSFSIRVLPAVAPDQIGDLSAVHSPQTPQGKPDTSVAQTEPSPTPELARLDSEILQVMPSTWINKLHYAAIKGFDHQILQLIQELPLSHAQFAETLKYWTENFHFDRIIRLTTPVIERQVLQ